MSKKSEAEMTVNDLVSAVAAVDEGVRQSARDRHAQLAKPPGSLGRLEELGAQLAAISGTCPPPVPTSPTVVIAAADHGVHAQGVSDWPQEVTQAMVATMATGGAAVNAFAAAVGAGVSVVDVGTVRTGPWTSTVPDGVVDARVRAGTRDLASAPAMTLGECASAIVTGAEVAGDLLADGCDLLVTGEVGLTNTTASACLYAAFCGVPAADVVGKGANITHDRDARKLAVVEQALARHGSERDPLRTLASLGGLELAALVGVMLAGAAARVPVIVDGVIAGASAVAATNLCPDLAAYLIPGHTSAEVGGELLAKQLGVSPLLDLGLRLGEGTGALLAVPLVQAAARVLNDMADISDVTASDG